MFPLLPLHVFDRPAENPFLVSEYLSYLFSALPGGPNTILYGFLLLKKALQVWWVLFSNRYKFEKNFLPGTVWDILKPVFQFYFQGNHRVSLEVTPEPDGKSPKISRFALRELGKEKTLAMFVASCSVFPMMAPSSFRAMVESLWTGRFVFRILTQRKKIFNAPLVCSSPEELETIRKEVFLQIFPMFTDFQAMVHKHVLTPVMGKNPCEYLAETLSDTKFPSEKQVFLFCLRTFSPAGRSLTSFSTHKNHERIGLDRFECGFCGLRFENHTDLKDHLINVAVKHNTVFDHNLHLRSRNLHSCPACNQVFEKVSDREEHLSSQSLNSGQCRRGQNRETLEKHTLFVREFAQRACDVIKSLYRSQSTFASTEKVFKTSSCVLDLPRLAKDHGFQEILGVHITECLSKSKIPTALQYARSLASTYFPEKKKKSSETWYIDQDFTARFVHKTKETAQKHLALSEWFN